MSSGPAAPGHDPDAEQPHALHPERPDPVLRPPRPVRPAHPKLGFSFVGMALFAVSAFLYLFAGLVAPVWAVLVLIALWVAAFVVACRWFVRRPVATFVLSVCVLAFWFVAINAGGAILGWTA